MENLLDEIFNFQDLSGTFSTTDVVLGLTLTFVLVSFVGWIYQKTHKGTSYTQSYVQTLVLMALVVDIIMLVVGSNIARAFSLVGALSIIRFRNAMKETRDVGFIFFAMAIGMATGTKFYFLAIVATIVICMIIYIMYRFDWYSRPMTSQILKIQVNNEVDFQKLFDDVFVKYTETSDLISVDSVRSGMLTELVYSVKLKKSSDNHKFLGAIKTLNGNLKVTLITGYNATDL
ncbi:MAG: DUF4956 domain-containing protein [Methanofastidiosum sp.]|jgi:uncharacterized membrane protein YhiD involved in acid resistance|nr:DUF4956 domain-containing protein [Bacteroidales bacterium]